LPRRRIRPGETAVDYDSVVYESYRGREETAYEEELLSACQRKEILPFLISLLDDIVKALNVGVKIIIDSEPVQFESVITLLSHAVKCAELYRDKLKIKDVDSAEFINVKFLLGLRPGRGRNIYVSFVIEKEKRELMRAIESVLMSSNVILVILSRGKPDVSVSSGLYFSNMVMKAVKRSLMVLDKMYGDETDDFRERLKYVGRLPHNLVLLTNKYVVKSALNIYTPPPPPNADFLREKPRRLNELVLPDTLKWYIQKYLRVIEMKGKGSLMLIGLPGAGRKTIAKALALELGYPSYIISTANILSRYLGESEGKLKEFFSGMRASGGLAVFDGVESLYKKSGAEGVTSNLRNILFQEMSREDNNFVIVFTVAEDSPGAVLDSPLLGETKLVIPVPNKEERKKLTRMFLDEIMDMARVRDFMLELASKRNKDYPEEVLYRMYADIFVELTAGFTPGEIYQVMQVVLIPAFVTMQEKKRLIGIEEDVIMLTKRDFNARLAKLRKLRKIARSIGMDFAVDTIKLVEEEVNNLAMEHAGEE